MLKNDVVCAIIKLVSIVLNRVYDEKDFILFQCLGEEKYSFEKCN